MINKKIEEKAINFLKEMGISEVPVPINLIAGKRGLEIMPYDLGDDVSGVLLIQNGKGTIGFNPNESRVRRRFTVAHELAHYELHRLSGDIFIDKEFKLYFRDSKSSTGEQETEKEANAFAAAILMPRDSVIREIKKLHLDLTDEFAIKRLAKQFQVSEIAMSIRMSNLNLF